MRPLAITGVGVASPFGYGYDAFAEGLTAEAAPAVFTTEPTSFTHAPHPGLRVAELRDFDPRPIVGDKGLRNNDRLTKLFLVGARLALEAAGIKRSGAYVALSPATVGVCASTAYGSLEALTELHRVARLEDPRYLNPARFPNTVINSALGYVSVWEDLRAANVTVTNGPTGALESVYCASSMLDTGRAQALLVGGGEAMSEALWQAFRRLELLDVEPSRWAPGRATSRGVRLGEGAALAVLEPVKAARARGATVLGEVIGYGTAFDPADDDAPMVQVSADALQRAIAQCLDDAGLTSVSLVASGVSGHPKFDAPEMQAIDAALGARVPVAAIKARTGETLGASGAMAMAAATAWLRGGAVRDLVRGDVGAVETVLITSVGFYGNASAVIVRRGGSLS